MYRYNVSIIVPVYNGAQYLGNCLDSLVNQTLDSYEIIIVNDGSTDNSLEIIRQYEKNYPQKIKCIDQENKGIYISRHTGIVASQGKYIGFCDCDDTIHNEMFKMMFDNLEQTNAELAVVAFFRFFQNKHQIEMNNFGTTVYEVLNHEELLPIINTSLWNKLFRADVIKQNFVPNEAMNIAEDLMILLTVFPHITKISFIDKPLYNYYVRTGSAMSTFDVKKTDYTLEQMKCVQNIFLYGNENNEKMIETMTIIFLIHMGLSLLLRCNPSDMHIYLKKVYAYLAENLSSWSQYHTYTLFKKYGFKISMIYLFYKTRMIYTLRFLRPLVLKCIKW